MADKKAVIDKLSKLGIDSILNWIVTNIDISTLANCLKNINPGAYKNFVKRDQITSWPINYPTQPESLEDIKMRVVDMAEGTRIIPLAVFPITMVNSDNFIDQSLQVVPSDDNLNFSPNEKYVNKIINIIKTGILKNKNLENKNLKEGGYTVVFTTISQNLKYVSSSVEFCSLGEDYSDAIAYYKFTNKDDVLNDEKEKLTSGEVYDYVNGFIQIYRGIFNGKNEKLQIKGMLTGEIEGKTEDILKKTIKQRYNLIELKVKGDYNQKDIDLDYFIVPYGRGSAWTNMDETGYHHIYSDRYYPDIKEYWENNVKNTNCGLLAYDENRNPKEGQFLVKYYENKKFKMDWMSKKEMETKCEKQTDVNFYNGKIFNPADITQELNSLVEGAPHYYTRVFGDYATGPFWKEKVDMRTYDASKYRRMMPKTNPLITNHGEHNVDKDKSGYDRARGGGGDGGGGDGEGVGASGAGEGASAKGDFGSRYSGFGLTPVEYGVTTVASLNREINERNGIPFMGPDFLIPGDTKVNACKIKLLNQAVEAILKGRREAGYAFGRNVRCSSSEKLQRNAAKGNVYLLGARFGSKLGSKFGSGNSSRDKLLAMVFNPKSGWSGSGPKWMSSKELSGAVNDGLSQRVSKEGISNFMKLGNLQIPEQHFKELSVQFGALEPSAFGYNQKVLKKLNKEQSGHQLYPLGKGAYLKGKHAGVSATYSQQHSERLGLWPKPKPVSRMVPKSQAQFGRSCFGKTVKAKNSPNNWSNNSIISAYTGKPMPGINRAVYGVNGTQGVYGGFTGTGGYPALSDMTISQGLVPLPRRSSKFGAKAKTTRCKVSHKSKKTSKMCKNCNPVKRSSKK